MFFSFGAQAQTSPDNAVWTLKLENAAEDGEELQVWIEIKDGKPYAGYATAMSISQWVHAVDVSEVGYNNETLTGKLGLTYFREVTYQKQRTYDGEYTIDCSADGDDISGSYSGSFDGKAASGEIRGELRSVTPAPAAKQFDLWLDGAFSENRVPRPLLQITVENGEIREKSFNQDLLHKGYGKPYYTVRLNTGGLGASMGTRFPISSLSADFRDSVFQAQFSSEATFDGNTQTYNYQLDGVVVGDRIIGTTTVETEGQSWEGRFAGIYGPPPPKPDPQNGMYTLAFADVLPLGGNFRRDCSVHAESESGSFGSGYALAPMYNRRRHSADLSGLSIEDSRLSGSITVSLSSDPNIAQEQIGGFEVTVSGDIDELGFISGVYDATVDGKSKNGELWGQILPKQGEIYSIQASINDNLFAGTPEIDETLAADAGTEYKTPVRPGIPGDRPFWTSSSLQYALTGRGVQSDSLRIPYWTKPPEEFIYVPSLEFPPANEAVRYEYRLQTSEGTQITFEDTVSWTSLGEHWDQVPVTNKSHTLSVTAYDADNTAISDTVRERSFIKKAPFEGPYFPAIASAKQRLLHYLRWMKNHAQLAFWQSEFTQLLFRDSGGAHADRSAQFCTAAIQAMLRLSRLTDDPQEAAFARRMAENSGYALLRSSRNWLDFGATQADLVTFNQFLCGVAYLELYEETGNAIWSEKAIKVARGLRQVQRPNGTWSFTDLDGVMSDGKHSHGGEAIDDFDPSAVIFFLGKLRTELNTSEFTDVENKAWNWLETHALRDFWWRYQPGHGLGQKTRSAHSPKEATFLVRYLLDYAPAQRRDVGLAEDIARYCEDQFTRWDRVPDEYATPHVIRGINEKSHYAPRASRTASVAHMFMRLYQETGNEIWMSKADELFKSVFMLQNPVNGGLNSDYEYPIGDQIKRGTIDPRMKPEYSINYSYPAVYLYDYVENSGVSAAARYTPTYSPKNKLAGISVLGGRRLRIALPESAPQMLDIDVLNLKGQTIRSIAHKRVAGRQANIISELPASGVYLVRIRSKAYTLVARAEIIK